MSTKKMLLVLLSFIITSVAYSQSGEKVKFNSDAKTNVGIFMDYMSEVFADRSTNFMKMKNVIPPFNGTIDSINVAGNDGVKLVWTFYGMSTVKKYKKSRYELFDLRMDFSSFCVEKKIITKPFVKGPITYSFGELHMNSTILENTTYFIGEYDFKHDGPNGSLKTVNIIFYR